MKNLRCTRYAVLPTEAPRPPPTVCTWDVSSDSVIVATGPARHDILLKLQRWSSSALAESNGKTSNYSPELIASWDAPCPLPNLECDQILDIHYFPDTASTCIVLVGGDIIIVRESPLPGEEKIEIVGSVDVGISAASWSPDEELLALTTLADTFLFMTREFENVKDVLFSPDDLRESKHVSVGWGKSETQFKGKGAKALRDPTMPEKVDEGLRGHHDDGSTVISWRGDGAFVAVNSVQATDRRVIRIYSREGTLDGVSEPTDYLESALSWRPAGNLMAAIQRIDGELNVIFFERNGLRHGQFQLRLCKKEVEEEWATHVALKWNMDSTVLAVCFKDRVQLWTMGNYHWYLKQEISLLSENGQQPFFSWHPEQPLWFAVGSSGQ